jgi:hypothetical protein
MGLCGVRMPILVPKQTTGGGDQAKKNQKKKNGQTEPEREGGRRGDRHEREFPNEEIFTRVGANPGRSDPVDTVEDEVIAGVTKDREKKISG